MTWPLEVLLEINRRVAESVLCLRLRIAKRARHLFPHFHAAHPLAAPARHRLEQHRIAPLGCLRFGFSGRFQGLARSRHYGHASELSRSPRFDLAAHPLHRLRQGPDEDDARFPARARQRRILCQEAVAGMQRLGAAAPRHVQQLVHSQVAFGGRRGPDEVGLIGQQHVFGGAVDVGVDRDSRDAHLAAGADDAHRNLPAVRNQYLLEHHALWVVASATTFKRWRAAPTVLP